jgi:serine/threonine protein kinase
MSWTVPGYSVERMLGLGSTGEVWGGRELATGERVALKRLRPGSANRDVLRHEAVLLAAFRHPHVVRLRGVLSTADGLVLVQTWRKGDPSRDCSGRGFLPRRWGACVRRSPPHWRRRTPRA